MDQKDIELLNTGFLKDECIRNATHFFCKAVLYACEYACEQDLTKGVGFVKNELMSFSNRNTSNIGVRPVSYSDDILGCFFNQKNNIPGHIYYWLATYYSNILGDAGRYTERHYDVYNKLQREYVNFRRGLRHDEKENAKFNKQMRRKCCQLYKSGEYSDIFELYGKQFENIIDTSTLENVRTLFLEFFADKIENYDIYSAFSTAYELGRIQGERMAAEKYAREQEGAAV